MKAFLQWLAQRRLAAEKKRLRRELDRMDARFDCALPTDEELAVYTAKYQQLVTLSRKRSA